MFIVYYKDCGCDDDDDDDVYEIEIHDDWVVIEL
jgi:hypothetical protein